MDIIRRNVLIGTGTLLVAPRAVLAQSPLIVTPGQTEGPFYPVTLPADRDADLVRVQGQAAQAVGQVTHVSGRVLDKRGEIVRGATVEIWQCDNNGVYNHPGNSGQRRRDAAFQGYGRTNVDGSGRYAFRTIRPVAYPGRTPHIHFKVHAPGVAADHADVCRGRGAERSVTVSCAASAIPRPARASSCGWIRPVTSSRRLKGTFDIVLNL